jgi:hypothetical protein
MKFGTSVNTPEFNKTNGNDSVKHKIFVMSPPFQVNKNATNKIESNALDVRSPSIKSSEKTFKMT